MIDVLNTALFGIKDEANKVESSIKLLKDAYAKGITACILTSPCSLHRKGDTERFLSQSIQEQEKLKQLNMTDVPKLFFGAKVFMDHDLSLHKNIDKLCIGNSKYLLIELPNFARIPDFDEWIYSLNMKGIVPIIAHAERHPLWKKIIDGLSGVKVCYQVNASTINSLFKRNFVKKLISQRKKFFVTSDTHNSASRTLNVLVARQKARKYFPKNFSSFFLDDFNF